MGRLKDWIFDLKYKFYVKHAELTPQGICFMQYCDNIVKGVHQDNNEYYEDMLLNAANQMELPREETALYLYVALSDFSK